MRLRGHRVQISQGLLSLSGFTQSFPRDGAGAAGRFRDGVGVAGGERPGWEMGHPAADQPWDLPAFFLSLSRSCLRRKELTDGVLHLWLNQSESPS